MEGVKKTLKLWKLFWFLKFPIVDLLHNLNNFDCKEHSK